MVSFPDQASSVLSWQSHDRSMIPPPASSWSAYQQQQDRPWHLFRRPLERRQQIYSHLLKDDIKYSPLPSMSWILQHRNLHDSMYALIQFLPCRSGIPELSSMFHSSICQTVGIEFYSNPAILKEYPSVGIQGLHAQMENRAAHLCQALTKAKDLRTVIVSLKEKTSGKSYDHKSDILRPLRLLCENGHPDLRFEIGGVVAAERVDEQEVAAALGRIVGDKLRVHAHNHSLA